MFQDITVDFNGSTVYTTHQQYQHLAYLSLLLHAPHSLKNNALSSVLYSIDKGGAFSLVSLTNAQLNPASFKRANYIDKSQTFEMKGHVLIDCLKVSKPILDGVDIGLNFFIHEPKSFLIANWDATTETAPDYTVEIEEARLEVGRIRPKQPTIPKCVYPYIHRDMLHIIHEKSLSYFGPVTIASGTLPKRVLVGLITETSYNGSYKENRLNFQNFNVDNAVVRVNSVDRPVRGGYVMDYKKLLYMDAYYGLFKEMGQNMGECQIGPIDFSDFDAGFALYAFDTSPGHTASNVDYGKSGSGTCELMIHFKQTPLVDNVVVLVMMEFERKFILHKLEPGNVRQYQFQNNIQ